MTLSIKNSLLKKQDWIKLPNDFNDFVDIIYFDEKESKIYYTTNDDKLFKTHWLQEIRLMILEKDSNDNWTERQYREKVISLNIKTWNILVIKEEDWGYKKLAVKNLIDWSESIKPSFMMSTKSYIDDFWVIEISVWNTNKYYYDTNWNEIGEKIIENFKRTWRDWNEVISWNASGQRIWYIKNTWWFWLERTNDNIDGTNIYFSSILWIKKWEYNFLRTTHKQKMLSKLTAPDMSSLFWWEYIFLNHFLKNDKVVSGFFHYSWKNLSNLVFDQKNWIKILSKNINWASNKNINKILICNLLANQKISLIEFAENWVINVLVDDFIEHIKNVSWIDIGHSKDIRDQFTEINWDKVWILESKTGDLLLDYIFDINWKLVFDSKKWIVNWKENIFLPELSDNKTLRITIDKCTKLQNWLWHIYDFKWEKEILFNQDFIELTNKISKIDLDKNEWDQIDLFNPHSIREKYIVISDWNKNKYLFKFDDIFSNVTALNSNTYLVENEKYLSKLFSWKWINNESAKICDITNGKVNIWGRIYLKNKLKIK
jgi:hypothetical protein